MKDAIKGDGMKNAIEQLALARYTEASCKKFLAQREAELQATPQWKQWKLESADLKTAKANVADAEANAHKVAMAVFAETDDRAPHPAVKVKDYVVLEYEDADAFDYALEHLSGALKLVKRTFENVAKVLKLDFVTITKEPRATIARDLSEYLPTGDA